MPFQYICPLGQLFSRAKKILTQQCFHRNRTLFVAPACHPRGGDSSKFFSLCSAQKQVWGVFLRGLNWRVQIQNKGYICWIQQVLRVAFELKRQNHCSKKYKGVILLFEYPSAGILDREKGCLFTITSRAGKRLIGVGTALPGPAWWVFLMSPHPEPVTHYYTPIILFFFFITLLSSWTEVISISLECLWVMKHNWYSVWKKEMPVYCSNLFVHS